MLTMIPKVIRERRRRAYTIIQKFMRGYHDFHALKFEIKQFRLVNNFEFFNKIRTKLLTDSQRLISYYWRKHLKRKNKLNMKSKKNTVIKKKEDPRITKIKKDKKSKVLKKTGSIKKGKSPKKTKKKLDQSIESKESDDSDLNKDIANVTKNSDDSKNKDTSSEKSSKKKKLLQMKTFKTKDDGVKSALIKKDINSIATVSATNILGGNLDHDEFRKRFSSFVPGATLVDQISINGLRQSLNSSNPNAVEEKDNESDNSESILKLQQDNERSKYEGEEDDDGSVSNPESDNESKGNTLTIDALDQVENIPENFNKQTIIEKSDEGGE